MPLLLAYGIGAVILVFWAAVLILLMHVEVIPRMVPSWLANFGGWTLAVVFLIRSVGEFNTVGLFKRIRKTPFARMDTFVYSPLCLFLSCLTVWLMLIT
ncbi:DUF3995 domain-containing protein [Paenibacillus luteus]|uniref:DUF3995 domain-containing protein n=1 Tax=Paenibacillus luteus TaxID=2545753 RepID=UPI001F5010D0|nr:DUF3995 domain-containing protein [Paenibacillus luteus]